MDGISNEQRFKIPVLVTKTLQPSQFPTSHPLSGVIKKSVPLFTEPTTERNTNPVAHDLFPSLILTSRFLLCLKSIPTKIHQTFFVS